MSPIDPDLTRIVRTTMPLCEQLGVGAEALGADEVVLQVAWDQRWCTNNDVLHGGVLMALADSAGAVLAFANLPDGALGTATIESKTNFLRAVRSGVVTATSRPLHVGSTSIVIETELRNGDRLVAKTTQTQAVLRG